MNTKVNKTNQHPDLKSPASKLKSEIINKIDDRIRTMRNNKPTFQEQIFECEILTTREDMSLDYHINEDDLQYELYFELNEQIKQIQDNSQTDSLKNYQNSIHLLELRKALLKSVRGLLTSRQLFALYHFTRFNHTAPFAPSLTCITRVLRKLYCCTDLSDWDIPNQDDFLRNVGHFQPPILDELIEILNNSEVIKYYISDPDNSVCYKLSDQDFLTTSYFNEEDENNNIIKNN